MRAARYPGRGMWGRSRRGVTLVSTWLACAAVGAGCGGDKPPPDVPMGPRQAPPASADIAELVISAHGADRFVACPPPGEIGQSWILRPFPWAGEALDAGAPPPVALTSDASAPVDQDYITRTKDYTVTERALEATRHDFRSCFRRTLHHNPTQDGRVAIVLRVGADGRVAHVEEYGACELSGVAIECMKAVAKRLRFPPPAAGSEVITIPAVFTSRDGVRKTTPSPNDTFTAAAFLVVESARPQLHACEQAARRQLRPVEATGTFTLALASDGRVTHVHIDPFTGDQTLLTCAAKALESLTFPKPEVGKGTVIARLNFNPRQGTR